MIELLQGGILNSMKIREKMLTVVGMSASSCVPRYIEQSDTLRIHNPVQVQFESFLER